MKEFQEQASREFRNINGDFSQYKQLILGIGLGIALSVIYVKFIKK